MIALKMKCSEKSKGKFKMWGGKDCLIFASLSIVMEGNSKLKGKMPAPHMAGEVSTMPVP